MLDAKEKWPCEILGASSLRSKRFRGAKFSAFCPREKWRAKIGMWGRGAKETLADKPLDFENLRSPANGVRDWLG